jgi:hypothetical protein
MRPLQSTVSSFANTCAGQLSKRYHLLRRSHLSREIGLTEAWACFAHAPQASVSKENQFSLMHGYGVVAVATRREHFPDLDHERSYSVAVRGAIWMRLLMGWK